VAENQGRIIRVNRNVSFFTTGYNWMIQIIPALIVAPLFMRGKVDFGVITQSAIAFSQLVGAFSLIVTQFQSLSTYAATSARLGALAEASEKEKRATAAAAGSARQDEARIAYQGLTLQSPRSGRVLIEDLTLEIPAGRRILVRGRDETARLALFQATAGLWESGTGRVVRPPLDQVLFLPELPYLPPGTIRELLLRPWPETPVEIEEGLGAVQVPEEQMMEALAALGIESLPAGFGGLDKRQYWENILPLDQQKLLVVARVLICRPRFVFLDRPGTALEPAQLDWILGLLEARGISYVTIEQGDRTVNLHRYDQVLELKGKGVWEFAAVAAEAAPEAPPAAPAGA